MVNVELGKSSVVSDFVREEKMIENAFPFQQELNLSVMNIIALFAIFLM